MVDYSSLVDLILESDDFVTVLRELKSYSVKTFDELVKIMQDFDKRVKAKGIDTKLTINKKGDNDGTLEWFVDQGYMGDKDRTLSIKSFDNGKVECDKSKKCRVYGSPNLNELADVNQILRLIEGYVFSLETEDNKQNNSQDSEDEKDPNKNGEENYELDPAVIQVLDKLKTDGETLINKFKSVPPLEYKGKKYKIESGKLMASTEKELVVNLLFPRADEIDIYADNKDGEALRRAILRYFPSKGFKGDKAPQFRYDMDRTPYFYASVGKLPVKQTKGPEARAILNYYDGNKVRFQPKEKS